MPSSRAIQEFKELLFQHYGVLLSDADALKQSGKLLDFTKPCTAPTERALTSTMKKASINRIRAKRSYSVKQAADVLGAHSRTIQAWIKSGLRILDGSRPFLIMGGDLESFLTKKIQERKQPLGADEFFCFRCKARVTAFQVETIPGKAIGLEKISIRLKGSCSACGGQVNKFSAVTNLIISTQVEILTGDGEGVLNADLSKEKSDGTKSISNQDEEREVEESLNPNTGTRPIDEEDFHKLLEMADNEARKGKKSEARREAGGVVFEPFGVDEQPGEYAPQDHIDPSGKSEQSQEKKDISLASKIPSGSENLNPSVGKISVPQESSSMTEIQGIENIPEVRTVNPVDLFRNQYSYSHSIAGIDPDVAFKKYGLKIQREGKELRPSDVPAPIVGELETREFSQAQPPFPKDRSYPDRITGYIKNFKALFGDKQLAYENAERLRGYLRARIAKGESQVSAIKEELTSHLAQLEEISKGVYLAIGKKYADSGVLKNTTKQEQKYDLP